MEGRHSPKHAAPTGAERRREERDKRRIRQEPQTYEYGGGTAVKTGNKPRNKKPVWLLIIQDIILTGLVLCIFATFHHVIPRLTASSVAAPTPINITPTPTPQATPEPEETAVPEETPELTPEVVDNRTEWQKKFEEHFTEDVVWTDNSYSSPDVSITIDTVTLDGPVVCYVADIYVAQIENFQSYFAYGEYIHYAGENILSAAQNAGAILSINGDYGNNQKSGFMVRNGALYFSEQTSRDICVLYYDGTMETYSPSQYLVEDVLERSPWQVWKFGPGLLDENGQPKEDFNTWDGIWWANPRSGIGYYEPGHYCFVIVDGRQPGYSVGLKLSEFAQFFADLGCTAAYNLDGGQSAAMTFNQQFYNQPYLGGRDIGDILLIRELPAQEEEGGSEE